MQVATEVTVDLFRIPKRITLAETIADAVARAIASGVLEPDERVTETAIADRVGVSRAPIREALKILHAQGILAADSSRGFRVAAFDDKTIHQVLEARLALETILLRDAVLQWRQHDPEATTLNVPIARMHEAAVNKDRAASLEADLSFHKAIAEVAENPIALTLWTAIARHVMIIFRCANTAPMICIPSCATTKCSAISSERRSKATSAQRRCMTRWKAIFCKSGETARGVSRLREKAPGKVTRQVQIVQT